MFFPQSYGRYLTVGDTLVERKKKKKKERKEIARGLLSKMREIREPEVNFHVHYHWVTQQRDTIVGPEN